VTGSITELELPVSSKKLKVWSLIFTGTSTAPASDRDWNRFLCERTDRCQQQKEEHGPMGRN